MNGQGSPSPSYRTFLTAAARHPALVGAVAPSSRALATHMASVVPSTGAPVVVELGAGTGSLSSAVQDRIPRAGRHIAVEIDADLVRYLRAAHQHVEVVHGDAIALAELLDERGVTQVDAVVSGLPWTLFSADKQRQLLEQVATVLACHGAFITFGYLHTAVMAGARQFHTTLGTFFDEIITSKTVWRNLPPARTYACRRPHAR